MWDSLPPPTSLSQERPVPSPASLVYSEKNVDLERIGSLKRYNSEDDFMPAKPANTEKKKEDMGKGEIEQRNSENDSLAAKSVVPVTKAASKFKFKRASKENDSTMLIAEPPSRRALF